MTQIEKFAKAFAFLARTDLKDLAVGRHEIAGDEVYASIAEVELSPWSDDMRFEAHRDYIDIQSPITGEETIGLADTPAEKVSELGRVAEDCVLWNAAGKPRTLVPGEFAIFWPSGDGHAPCHSLTGSRRIRKVVIKIRA